MKILTKALLVATYLCIQCLTNEIKADNNTYPFPQTGNVGIGTQNPRSLLEIRGPLLPSEPGSRLDLARFTAPTANDDRLELFMMRNAIPYNQGGNWDTNEIWLQRAVDVTRMAYIKFTDHNLALGAGGQDVVYINNAGNMGIGTSSLNYRLSVEGSTWTRMLFVGDGSHLGYNQGNEIILSDQSVRSEQHTKFITKMVRTDYGGTWETCAIQLLRKTDATDQAYISLYRDNVGIGTLKPSHPLSVNGAIRAKEIIVDNTGWADDVFTSDYELQSLSEVKNHIVKTGHLPGIPSASEITANGISVGETQSMLLRKIEELTLHAIQQQEFLSRQAQEIQKLREEIQLLKSK